MKFQKSIVALVLALILALTLSIPVFAAETGAQDAPYLGGNNYGDADGASLQLHKLDIAGFERNKAAALIEDGTLAAGGTVSYTGNVPLGTALAGGDVVGTYTTSAAPDAKVDVTLKELAALGNITFRIEQVQLTNCKTPGSTSPDDY